MFALGFHREQMRVMQLNRLQTVIIFIIIFTLKLYRLMHTSLKLEMKKKARVYPRRLTFACCVLGLNHRAREREILSIGNVWVVGLVLLAVIANLY